ncbi:DEAD/DEAH box helicase [Oleiagrimonas sp. C23AA]|uniref:DEAD/DEAH box helicase n=1 Tax=Oleiagrimonas sp. C23AA TaxID=2719047 RepID=UPI0014245A0E|nr:DEAD/DEAH box helicase [Oleiagrimonas sp. C23AA]NII09596.1 DEAD/DEAH box helicase [Oleiagrimonas sp. C23AA]
MSFSDLGLAPELLRALTEQGYESPTPVQAQAIPFVLEGRDLLASAQTGTGKTAAFTLPLLHRLIGGEAKRTPRALVLVPTRELAAQVAESVRTYARHVRMRTAVIFGGVGMGPQTDALRRGVDIVVATPGRLLDHIGQRHIDLSGIQTLILDEADRMLDMGFIRDIRKVIAALPKQRQNLLFSATFSGDILKLAEGLLSDPARVEVAPRNTTAERVSQSVYNVDKSNKTALITHLVGTGNWRQVLVFTRTKHGANRLALQLERNGLTAAAIHGNKSQNARTRALADFKAGKVRVLVATDIAARGLDIDQLPHVINHELPNVPEDYVHRIGRTGRAGAEGEAISLVAPDERKLLRDIERLLKRKLDAGVVEGFEPDPNARAEPEEAPRRGGGRGQGASRSGGGRSQAGGRGQGSGNARPGAGRGNAASGDAAKPAGARRRRRGGRGGQSRQQGRPQGE